MSAAELVAAAVSGARIVSVRARWRNSSVTEAVSVAAAYIGASMGESAEASAEAVAVSAAVLVGRSFGHLVRYSYFSVYLLVRVCVRM